MTSSKIIVKFIIEIAGKPKDNVDKALALVLDKLKEKKGDYRVKDSVLEESLLDEKTTLYSGFLDVEVQFENIGSLLGFIIDYTPTSVEIVDPENISIKCNELTNFLNDSSHAFLSMQNQIRILNANLYNIQNSKK